MRAISAALHNTLCTPVSPPFRGQAPPSGIHSPLAVRCNLPSLAPSGPNFSGHMFPAAPLSRFILTHSNRFGLLVALTSKPPTENKLAELSFASSQPSCHPTELQSSFHSAGLSHHDTKNCQWYTSVQDSWVSELVADFEFSRPEKAFFEVLPLCEPLAPWIALLVPLDFPLNFPLFSSFSHLPSLLDHDLLAACNVRKRFELSIKCFSSSSGTNAPDQRAGSHRLVCPSTFSQRGTWNSQRSISA